MVLNQTAEYALRAMAFLATNPKERLISVAELAEGTRVPQHYLSKIMRRLVLADLVHAQRGHGGGFQLKRPPDTIRFADVLEAVDVPLDDNHCAFGLGHCNPQSPCALHDSWMVMSTCFRHWASQTTLASTAEISLPGTK